jgi:cytidylate kinase
VTDAPNVVGARVIAIDGPAGAGKSTVARALAARLGLAHLDTGAMYRAVTFAAVRRGVDLHDRDAVAALARDLDLVVDQGVVTVDGIDATTGIRTPEITASVAAVAANPDVRTELVRRQRTWAIERGGGVLEGRDIGSVVFPDAELKLYLTASPRVRAERRVAESGGDVDEIAAAIAVRDASDKGRDVGALTDEGATRLDTTGLTVDEVLDAIELLLGEGRG